MPELPEVHTTSKILNELVRGKKIADVWTDYFSSKYEGKENIKNKKYFPKFKKEVVGKKIRKVYRRAKNVLIELEGYSTILIHMKMTGHLLYGEYIFDSKKKEWLAKEEGPLQDPFNRFIHLVISFEDGTHIAFSDMRKFATVQIIKTKEELQNKFETIGPEPLDKNFEWRTLKECLTRKPKQKIKTALMDQSLVVGIGNIYSDEILWESKIHPERIIKNITDSEFRNMIIHTKSLLEKGISFGGDSMSDYRNPYGLPGEFQLHHNAYRRTKQSCNRKNCNGIIERKVIAGRSAHFCSICQK